MAVHSFDTEIAKVVGVNAATIYQNIMFWCEKNKANNSNFNDSNWWVYNSVSAWANLFPYMSTRSIRTSLDKLIESGLIEKGDYNDKPYDKTTWYAICQNRQIHLSELTTPFVKNAKPIPVSKPISKPVSKLLRENEFNEFWDTYGKKKDLTKCKAKFLSLSDADVNNIMAVVSAYVRSTPDTQFRKNPATWINGKCWLDDIDKPKTNNKNPIQGTDYFDNQEL